MRLSQSDRESILRKTLELIEKKHFNPEFNCPGWRKTLEARSPKALETQTPEEFEVEMDGLVSLLGTSHTLFFHQNAKRVAARYAICATVQPTRTQNGFFWMFQDVFEDGPASQAGLEPGDLLLAVNHGEIHPPAKPFFRMGETNTVTIEKRFGHQASLPLVIPQPRYRRHRPMCLPRLISTRKLPNGIGLLQVTFFRGIFGMTIARQIDQAFAELKDCDRLIVDLRGNYGGGVGCFRLMGYFTPAKVPVGYSLSRTLIRRLAGQSYDKETFIQFSKLPSSRFEIVRNIFRFLFTNKSVTYLTEGLGPQRFQGRMVLLVNEHTSSASEIVAGFVSRNRLATVIGTRTAGELLGGFSFKAGHGYILRLPTSAFCLWQGDEMLDGKGLPPDVEVPLSYELLKEGRDSQLEAAIQRVLEM
jgi:carboxyl-terminal processing protease